MKKYFISERSFENIDYGDDHLILRGGGGGKFCRDGLFIFSISSAGKFFHVYQGQNIYFHLFSPAKNFRKAKKKKKKKKKTQTGDIRMLVG